MKDTKKRLLSSIATLFVCFAMLIGSTYAWFTDSASTGVNKIQAGNLDVKLLTYRGLEGYVDVERTPDDPLSLFSIGTSNNVAQNKNLDTLWEPGKTQVAFLRIENKGNLALKYQVEVQVINPSDGNNLYQALSYVVVPDATTEVKDMLVDDDVQKAKIDKQNVKNNDSDKTDTTVLSKLSIKKQSENVSEKIEAEEIVSDGKVTMSKDTVEEKPKVTTSTQKKKSKGLFAKKDKNVTTKSINLKKDDYDAILDKEEQSIKLPQKKEKPVLKDYEEDIVKRHNPSFDKPNVDTQSKVVKEDEMKKEVEPKAVSQKPNKVEKPYTATYVSSTNVRVMGIDPTKETLDPVKHEEKVLPKVENVEKKVFEKPAVSESKPIDFDTDKIDVSKLMGYDSELDKTFDILDKNYHGKGGNE